MINSFNCSQDNSNSLNGTRISSKGSRFPIAAFLLLIATFLTTACESPAPIGDDIISDDDEVSSQTVLIEDYTIVEDNSFSGRLANTAIGRFDDPLYGTMKSVALLKPAITSTDVDTIKENGTVSLRLIFNDPVYGDSLSTSNYEIFEVGRIWRGAELRFNEEVPVDMASKVGEFQVEAHEDTVIVDLNQSWTTRFAEYFNPDTTLSGAERDSIYINNFPGIAIVPSESNQKIRFLKTQTADEDESGSTDDDDEAVTSFLYTPFQQIGNSEVADSSRSVISVRDWGMSFTRTNAPETGQEIVLHNSERALKLQLDLPLEELSSKSIVNAKLIFSKDDIPQKNTPQITRPNTNVIRAHVFDDEPADVMGEIFTSDASFATVLDDTSNTFLLNITQHVLDEVYGEEKGRLLYITIESINGILYTSHFFDPDSDDLKKPRLVITYVEN